MDETKKCSWCGRELPIERFRKDARYIRTERRISICCDCESFQQENNSDTYDPSKRCRICGGYRPLYMFGKNDDNYDGLNNYCDNCKDLVESSGDKLRLINLNEASLKYGVAYGKIYSASKRGCFTLVKSQNNVYLHEDELDAKINEVFPYASVYKRPPIVPQDITNVVVQPENPPTEGKKAPTFPMKPQLVSIHYRADDKVIRLKDGIFLLETLSGNISINSSADGIEILYETTDGDLVAEKDLFKNKREAIERTKLINIPEDRLTYGNKPNKQ